MKRRFDPDVVAPSATTTEPCSTAGRKVPIANVLEVGTGWPLAGKLVSCDPSIAGNLAELLSATTLLALVPTVQVAADPNPSAAT
jgi:hypothetical protein